MLLEVSSIDVRYGRNHAVKGLSFNVGADELVGGRVLRTRLQAAAATDAAAQRVALVVQFFADRRAGT